MLAAVAVLFAGALHATWNALAKAVSDRHAAFGVIGITQSLICLPLLPFVPPPAAEAWPYEIVSIALQLVYMLLLIRCYDLGDFGQVYPIARGSAPLLVATVAAFQGETLTVPQVCGLAAMCGGLAALALAGTGRRRMPSRAAVTAAVLTGATIAAYTVVDGMGVRRSGTALGYTTWMFAIEGVLVLAMMTAVRGRSVLPALRDRWRVSAAGGVISMLGYGLVLWAQTRSPLAEVAALRETGILWGALIGAVFFSERLGRLRIAAAGVVTLGVVLLSVH
ncbi:DMT family transporter [Microtetraspora niveoalba]|uniref:DMT family transporter n=1 Tax=Microtetraspora niveoalba TaxID=46175 RepID=UPI000B276CB5|nr:DMT family transporter [Microtetraspora niveoalba]